MSELADDLEPARWSRIRGGRNLTSFYAGGIGNELRALYEPPRELPRDLLTLVEEMDEQQE